MAPGGVVLDTHSVGLDDLAFERIVALRTPDGSDVTPLAIEEAQRGSGHHREAVVVFAGLRNPVLVVVSWAVTVPAYGDRASVQ